MPKNEEREGGREECSYSLTVECKKNECAFKTLVHNISAEISSNHMK
jgi:hypothetical protein